MAVIDQLFIDLIRHQQQIVLIHEVGQGLDLLLCEHTARGVAGVADDHHLALIGELALQNIPGDTEIVLMLQRNGDAGRPRHLYDLLIGYPVGFQQHSLIAGLQEGHQRLIQGQLAAGRYDDLGLGIGCNAVLLQQLSGNGFPQLHQSRRRGVVGHVVMNSLDALFLDPLRGIKVRLTAAEDQHIQPLPLHLQALGQEFYCG